MRTRTADLLITRERVRYTPSYANALFFLVLRPDSLYFAHRYQPKDTPSYAASYGTKMARGIFGDGMANKIAFTKRALEALRPAAKRYYRADTKVTGLGIAVYPSGSKRFFFRRGVAAFDTGRLHLGIWQDGDIPDMTIDQARRRAQAYNTMVNEGTNPADELAAARARQKHAITWSKFFRIYLEQHSRVHKKTWRSDWSQYKNHLAIWRNRTIWPDLEITPADVSHLFAKLVNAGHAPTANKVLAQARSMFARAAEWGMVGGPNPAAGIKKKAIAGRIRRVEPGEFPDLFAAIAAYPHDCMRELILAFVFIPMRSGNTKSMEIDAVSFTDGSWSIPDTKSGEPEIVPLSTIALELLSKRVCRMIGWDMVAKWDKSQQAKSRFETTGDAGDAERFRQMWTSVLGEIDARRGETPRYMFPSRSKCGHIVEYKRAWDWILTRAGIANDGPRKLRIHDMRRTICSIQANEGISLTIASRTLAHRNLETTRKIYTIVDMDPMRHALDTAANKMREYGCGYFTLAHTPPGADDNAQ